MSEKVDTHPKLDFEEFTRHHRTKWKQRPYSKPQHWISHGWVLNRMFLSLWLILEWPILETTQGEKSSLWPLITEVPWMAVERMKQSRDIGGQGAARENTYTSGVPRFSLSMCPCSQPVGAVLPTSGLSSALVNPLWKCIRHTHPRSVLHWYPKPSPSQSSKNHKSRRTIT